MKKKLVVVNGSYHKKGLTTECLRTRTLALMEELCITQRNVIYFFLDDNIRACVDCGPGKCVKGCRYKDQFQEIVAALEDAAAVLIGSPVYLDMPTAKVTAFLSRLNCYAEPTKREFFRGKKVYLHANGYCSGTKKVISSMMGACEMLGFIIPGRSTSEYMLLWKDKKIRGGVTGGWWLDDKICSDFICGGK